MTEPNEYPLGDYDHRNLTKHRPQASLSTSNLDEFSIVKKFQSQQNLATQTETTRHRRHLFSIALLLITGLISIALGLAGALTNNMTLIRVATGLSGVPIAALAYALFNKAFRRYITWLKKGWGKAHSPTLASQCLRIASLLLPTIALLVFVLLDIFSSVHFFSHLVWPGVASGALGALNTLGWATKELSAGIIVMITSLSVISLSIGFATAKLYVSTTLNQLPTSPPPDPAMKEETDPLKVFQRNMETDPQLTISPHVLAAHQEEKASWSSSFKSILNRLGIGACFGVQPDIREHREHDDSSSRWRSGSSTPPPEPVDITYRPPSGPSTSSS